MDDDGGYFGEDGEWWLNDFGISQDDVDKIFATMKVREDNSLKQTLALLAVDNLSPSEHGLKLLKQYSRGGISYTQAIDAINKEVEKVKVSNQH